MKFTQQQLEIIAYSVSLLHSDGENYLNTSDNLEMRNILGGLQEVGIWGNIDLEE